MINIIPKMAVSGIRRSSSAYLPYIAAASMCICIFYIFTSIRENDIMNNVPHATYVIVLMEIGEVLLGIILIPFLLSINNFLLKQRKKELGLYSVLGLEKRHIGFMLFIESVILYFLTSLIGIITATVFSKLAFLFLLKITHLPIDTKFTFSPKALAFTLIFFGAIALCNLIVNLVQVSTANPTELFHASKSGEKEPKHIFLHTIIGVLCLGGGYAIALRSQINIFIFMDFFFAVLLVIIGTYQLFESGSISLLKACRNNKKYYYTSKNFVTVSGMLYRMKKNASSLANICIFCTMTIVTLLCTVSVFIGEDDAIDFRYPADFTFYMNSDSLKDKSAFDRVISDTSSEYGIEVSDLTKLEYQKLYVTMNGDVWESYSDVENLGNYYCVFAISLDDYNKTQNTTETLADNEILYFSTSSDYGLSTAVIDGKTFNVKKELNSISFTRKNEKDMGDVTQFAVFSRKEIYADFHQKYEQDSTAANNRIYMVQFNIKGENEDEFTAALIEKTAAIDGFNKVDVKSYWITESYTLIGGLLFLGIFFGLVFIICMVLIMYYKQISEGYEDKKNFEIMQKVGMSDKEVRETVSRQILTVFFMPLAISVLHTAVAIKIVCNLLATIQIFDTAMILICGGVTLAAFVIIYGASYMITAKAYYKIVK